MLAMESLPTMHDLPILESINSPSCQSNAFYQTSKTGLLLLLGRVSEDHARY